MQNLNFKGKIATEIAWRAIGKRPDDRYVVSYPRSGSTWVRTVLVNLLRPNEAARKPHLFNDFIPGVELGNVLHIRALQSPRFLSSHTSFRRNIPCALYLVRDGRDVLVSYYHYLITRQGKEQSFTQFFALYCQGGYGQLWHEHVECWLTQGQSELGERFMVVRFEDLKARTEEMFGEVARFFKISASPEQLVAAIQAASLERRREIEKKMEPDVTDENARFYRGGETGQWKRYMTPSIESRFREMSSTALRLGGYT